MTNTDDKHGPPIRMMVVDEEPLMLDLLERGLSKIDGFAVVGTARDRHSALEVAGQSRPDVVLVVNRAAQVADCIEMGQTIKSQLPALGIVLLAERADLSVLRQRVFDQGPGWSYFLRDSIDGVRDLEQAIRSAAVGLTTIGEALAGGSAGDPDGPKWQLTLGQERVLALVADGLSNQAIAEQLEVSYRTVEYHLNEVYRRMECGDAIKFNRRVCAALHYRKSGAASPV